MANIKISITTISKEGRQFPALFIDDLEKAIRLVWDDYEALDEIRQRLTLLRWQVDHRLGNLWCNKNDVKWNPNKKGEIL